MYVHLFLIDVVKRERVSVFAYYLQSWICDIITSCDTGVETKKLKLIAYTEKDLQETFYIQ